MGCGASKGASGVVPTVLPVPEPAPVTEFTPESKPRQPDQAEEQARVKESREAAKRVDNIIKSSGVSAFDDDADAKLDATAEPVQVTVAPSQPAPPSTPPVTACKSPAEKALSVKNTFVTRAPGPTAEESLESPFFPKQVPLNLGESTAAGEGVFSPPFQPPEPALQPLMGPLTSCSAGSPPQGDMPSRATSLQPFEPPSESVSLSPLPTIPSGRIIQQQPPSPPQLPQQLPEPRPQQPPQQLQRLASQPAQQQPQGTALPPLPTVQEEPQAPAAAASPPAPAADDPWSSLQSQYRIREQSVADPQPTVGAVSTRSRAGAGRGGPGEAGREVLVLGGDDDDFGGGGGGPNSSMGLNSTSRSVGGYGGRGGLPPPKPGSQPKKGGWGSGQMARAGELMIGEDDWLENDRPPGVSAAQQQGGYRSGAYGGGYGGGDDDGMDEEDLPPPQLVKKQAAKDDVQFEDIEDVDALLGDDEKPGLSNKDLASKLAAYEAQFGDEDDEPSSGARGPPPMAGPRTWKH